MSEVNVRTVAEFETEDGETIEVRSVDEETEGFDGLIIEVDESEVLRLSFEEASALIEALQNFV